MVEGAAGGIRRRSVPGLSVLRLGFQERHLRAQISEEVQGHIFAEAAAHHDPLHGDLLQISGQRIGRHLPAEHPQPVGEVVERPARLMIFFEPPGEDRDIRSVVPELEGFHRADLRGQLLSDLARGLLHFGEPFTAQSEELVVLQEHLRPGREKFSANVGISPPR